MAERELTENALPLVERLPKDLIDPDARDRLARFLRRVGEVVTIDERGRAVADSKGLHALVTDAEFFPPSVSKALESRLADVGDEVGDDERGRVRPLSPEDIDRMTSDLTREGLDSALSDLIADRPWAGTEIATIEDGPQPAEDPPEPIPQEDVDGKLDAFFDCIKEDVGYLAVVVVMTAIGIILAIVGVFVPPVEIAAVQIIIIFGAELGAYIMHCLVKAGFFLS